MDVLNALKANHHNWEEMNWKERYDALQGLRAHGHVHHAVHSNTAVPGRSTKEDLTWKKRF